MISSIKEIKSHNFRKFHQYRVIFKNGDVAKLTEQQKIMIQLLVEKFPCYVEHEKSLFAIWGVNKDKVKGYDDRLRNVTRGLNKSLIGTSYKVVNVRGRGYQLTVINL